MKTELNSLIKHYINLALEIQAKIYDLKAKEEEHNQAKQEITTAFEEGDITHEVCVAYLDRVTTLITANQLMIDRYTETLEALPNG